uniref:Uncharacterized protein n=1 Tax=Glossina brevipalpis TaxID=37001 RepID=A0A1A9WI13_9MUSC
MNNKPDNNKQNIVNVLLQTPVGTVGLAGVLALLKKGNIATTCQANHFVHYSKSQSVQCKVHPENCEYFFQVWPTGTLEITMVLDTLSRFGVGPIGTLGSIIVLDTLSRLGAGSIGTKEIVMDFHTVSRINIGLSGIIENKMDTFHEILKMDIIPSEYQYHDLMSLTAIKSKAELFAPPPDEGHVVVSNTVVDSVSETLACVRPEPVLLSRSVTDDVSVTRESPIVVPELGILCTASVRDWQNPLPHSAHLKGFSFEWIYLVMKGKTNTKIKGDYNHKKVIEEEESLV